MSQKSNQSLLIVLLVLGALFLATLGICACGGIFLFRNAAIDGMQAAETTRNRIEVENMVTAIEMYRAMHRQYPPNFDDPQAVDRHLRMAFPRFSPSADGVAPIPENLDAAEALVFWLHGFGPNPTDPLARTTPTLFECDPARLRDEDGDGHEEYYPVSGLLPYVYFHHDVYEFAKFTFSTGDGGIAQPYRSDEPGAEFVHRDGFQIISAGRDNHYGQGGSFPNGEGYSAEDFDNITNFAAQTLGDAKRLNDR